MRLVLFILGMLYFKTHGEFNSIGWVGISFLIIVFWIMDIFELTKKDLK